MKHPWLKFYPSNWRADPALRMCSLAARGLWMEMLCIMHEAIPRGSLLVNGLPVSGKQLASLCGAPLIETVRLMGELAGSGVFSRETDGTIYSRRMRIDEARAQRDKANGAIGGNPSLKQGVNPHDNGEDKAKKLEDRIQNPEKKKDSRAVADATRPIAGDRFPEFWEAYPKRDGANPKKPAHKSFSAAVKSGHDPQGMIDAARRYRAALRGKNQESTSYVAQAQTWLHQARWEDYPAPSPIEISADPKPPEPDMPSHAELLKRYGGNDGATPAIDGSGADHQQELPPAGPDIRATGEGAPGRPVADHQGRKSGMPSLGEIFRSSPGLAPLRPEDASRQPDP